MAHISVGSLFTAIYGVTARVSDVGQIPFPPPVQPMAPRLPTAGAQGSGLRTGHFPANLSRGHHRGDPCWVAETMDQWRNIESPDTRGIVWYSSHDFTMLRLFSGRISGRFWVKHGEARPGAHPHPAMGGHGGCLSEPGAGESTHRG